jgi:hypothetical protein
MTIAGSPKKLVQDIANAFFTLSPPLLRQYDAGDLRTLLTNIALVGREIRGEQVPLDDVMALKAKNLKLSRLNQAEMVIRAYGKKHRLPL